MTLGIAVATGGALIPMKAGIAESGEPVRALPALITPAVVADPRIANDPTLLADDTVTFSPASSEKARDAASPVQAVLSADERELECMAKVVRHEAANQSRRGQLAVAQIMVNRARSGRFPSTMCAVANQPGQFFDIDSYNPPRETPQWKMAMEVSREAFAGNDEDVTNGAYFYHAAYQSPPAFFQKRQRVSTLGDHIFYR